MRNLPPNPLQTYSRYLILGLACAGLGCARFPATGVPQSTRLLFSFTVAGTIRTGQEPGATSPYIYMVAIKTNTVDNPTTGGPVPVVAPPWGNGFVAGQCDYFIWADPSRNDQFIVYRFLDTALNNFVEYRIPVRFTQISTGTRRIEFELDIEQIAATPADAANLRSLQVNLLTMDRIPPSSSTSTAKNWDALGDSRLPTSVNEWVRIPLRTSGVYDNLRLGNIEPDVADVVDPDLDIRDFRIEVRLQ
jgi:hypothetical protein